MTAFRDVLGQEPKIGDILFYGQTGRWSEFMISEIIKLTPKGVRIKKIKGDRTGFSYEEVQVNTGSHAVIITDLAAAQKYRNTK